MSKLPELDKPYPRPPPVLKGFSANVRRSFRKQRLCITPRPSCQTSQTNANVPPATAREPRSRAISAGPSRAGGGPAAPHRRQHLLIPREGFINMSDPSVKVSQNSVIDRARKLPRTGAIKIAERYEAMGVDEKDHFEQLLNGVSKAKQDAEEFNLRSLENMLNHKNSLNRRQDELRVNIDLRRKCIVKLKEQLDRLAIDLKSRDFKAEKEVQQCIQYKSDLLEIETEVETVRKYIPTLQLVANRTGKMLIEDRAIVNVC
jgi:hypothetical protein